IGIWLQVKVDPADLVQESFLSAHRDFARFRGTTEPEWSAWLRQILAARLGDLMRRYCGTQRRDVRLERELEGELDESSRVLDRGLGAKISSPSRQAVRREQAVLLAEALEQLREDQREVV